MTKHNKNATEGKNGLRKFLFSVQQKEHQSFTTGYLVQLAYRKISIFKDVKMALNTDAATITFITVNIFNVSAKYKTDS